MEQLSIFTKPGIIAPLPAEFMEYEAGFYSPGESLELLTWLISTTQWSQSEIQMYGKMILTPRLSAWYGDEGSTYQFSGNKYDPFPWTAELESIRQKVEARAGIRFNSVLLNYYRDGNDSVAWHSDNEKELRRSPVIASLSLGQERRFDIRRRDDYKSKHSILLENGSLLLMKAALQEQWQHRIAKSARTLKPRINLTFRVVDRS